MKKLVLTAMTILAVCGLSACGNVQNNDKEVATTSATGVQTAVTTTDVSEPEVVTSVSSGDPIVTTGETATKPTETTPIVTTSATTTTVTTAKATTTTTKKATTTTTTKKTTTTTKKKPTATTTTKKKDNTNSNSSVKGVTKWIGWETHGFTVGKNLDWWDNEYDVVLKEGDQITAYETVTVNTSNGGDRTLTRIKMSNGKYTYVLASEIVDEKPYIVEITESDVKKLCAELQEYSTALYVEYNEERVKARIERLKDKLPDGYSWETHMQEMTTDLDEYTPSNSSWHNVADWYVYQHSQNGIDTYENNLAYWKRQLDYEYKILPNSHQVVYYELTKNSYSGELKWDIYLLY